MPRPVFARGPWGAQAHRRGGAGVVGRRQALAYSRHCRSSCRARLRSVCGHRDHRTAANMGRKSPAQSPAFTAPTRARYFGPRLGHCVLSNAHRCPRTRHQRPTSTQVLGEIVPQLFPSRVPAHVRPTAKQRFCRHFLGVSDGARTHDRLDHNQELYQLSYAHHGSATGKFSAGSALVGARTGDLAFGQGKRFAGGQPGRACSHLAPGRQQPLGVAAQQRRQLDGQDERIGERR